MSCLNGVIGISNRCSTSVPTSGLYINQLPGMSLNVANAATNSEMPSGVALIEEKISLAQKYLENDLTDFLKDKFKVGSILENESVGYYKEDYSVISAISSRLRGIKITVRDYPYLQLEIPSVGIKLDDAITDNIYIYDLSNNKLLETIAFTSVAGEVVYVDVNKSFRTNKQKLSLFVCMDASVADQYATSLSGSPKSCCANPGILSWVSSGYILSASQKIDSNFVSNSSTGGITLEYNISCDLQKFICSLSNLVAWPLLYRTGAEILRELKFSKNLNSYVVIDAADNDDLLMYYESEYEKKMNQLVKNMRVPDDICFQCDRKIRKTVQIP